MIEIVPASICPIHKIAYPKTEADARATVAKVKKINKPYARKIQILTVAEQRAKVMGKTEVVAIFKKAKESLKKAHERKKKKV